MAYNGNSSKIVSSSFLYSTLQTFYTKIKGLLDKKADKTALNSINPNTISGGYTKSPFYINTHPENSGAIIPFVNNDIAFLLKRGGSAKVYYDGVEKSVDISNVFDGSPSYWYIDPSGYNEIVIELTLHKTFRWTSTVYVDFGSASWRAKSIKIDVINTNNNETEWTNKSTITNNTIGQHKIAFLHNNETGFNKVRFTFSGWVTEKIFRITCLGIVNYSSSGLRETFLPKDGGSVYGEITPYTNNSIDLGSSSTKWKNAYATTFNGNLSGNADSATNADTVDGLHGSDLQRAMVNLAKNTNVLEYADNYPVTNTGGTMFTYRVIDGYNEPFAENKIGSGDYYYYANKLYDDWITLIAIHVRSSNIYMRNKNNGVWSSSWRCVSDSGNAQTSVSTSNLSSTGFGSGTLTYLQTSGDFYDNTGWCHYIIANHGDGEAYYNYAIALPFWDTPKYQRQVGSTGARSGWQQFYTTENLTYGTQSLTPGTSSLKSGHIYLQYE
jgi:hypothetical protein